MVRRYFKPERKGHKNKAQAGPEENKLKQDKKEGKGDSRNGTGGIGG